MNAFQAMRYLCAIITFVIRWGSIAIRSLFSNSRHVTASGALLIAACMIVESANTNTAVLHVNAAGNPSTEDGETWSTAYRFLQDALGQAEILLLPGTGFTEVELWVAAGTYRPDQSMTICGEPCVTGFPASGECFTPCGSTDPFLSFELRNNVGIFGGFSGTEDFRHDRRPLENITILSGPANRIVTSNNNNQTARLDGFHIAFGTVGIDMDGSSAIVSNCTIRIIGENGSFLFSPLFVHQGLALPRGM